MPLIYAFTVLFGIQFALVHFLAEKFELYWRYGWLDMPMHIFGGILVVLILGSLSKMKLVPRWLMSSWRLPLLLAGVLLAWEAFGVYRFGGLKPDFWSDSILDLFCGSAGIICGFLLVRALTRLDNLGQ